MDPNTIDARIDAALAPASEAFSAVVFFEVEVLGEADVGATFTYFDDSGRIKRAGWGMDVVRVIESAGPIPNDVIAARRGLPDLLVRVVQSALVDVQNAQLRDAARTLLTAEGFMVPTAQHFAPIEELLSQMRQPEDAHALSPPAPTAS